MPISTRPQTDTPSSSETSLGLSEATMPLQLTSQMTMYSSATPSSTAYQLAQKTAEISKKTELNFYNKDLKSYLHPVYNWNTQIPNSWYGPLANTWIGAVPSDWTISSNNPWAKPDSFNFGIAPVAPAIISTASSTLESETKKLKEISQVSSENSAGKSLKDKKINYVACEQCGFFFKKGAGITSHKRIHNR
jgi:hypothetical protein